MILESTYTTEYGIPCLWPQFKYSADVWEWRVARHYHNGRLWPFVQGYWAMAAAHHGREDVFSVALKGITALSQIGNTFAEYYNLNGTYLFGGSAESALECCRLYYLNDVSQCVWSTSRCGWNPVLTDETQRFVVSCAKD